MRVKAVVGTTIKVAIEDVLPGDVLGHTNREDAAMIVEVQRNKDGQYRFRYDIRNKKPRFYGGKWHDPIEFSLWLDPDPTKGVFIHDLHRERFDFLEEAS